MRKLIFFLSLLNLLPVYGQKFAPNAKISHHEKLLTGVLPNGMTYFILPNAKPEKRVEFRLAVKAGSINEDNDQLGLAHFTEHMCFNGSQHFAKNELVSYLQRVGVQFGAHLNAYTSFDETVYMLPVPTDNVNIVDSALLILQDWASAVSFDSTEIEAERGIVMEEWRSSLGAEERMFNKLWPVILKGSQYAKRLPIGTPEVLKSFDKKTIYRYYKDWYRPDLIAIIAVGDFDPKEMEQKIIKTFGSIPARQNPRKKETYTIPAQTSPIVGVASDKEATSTNLSVYYVLPEVSTKTWGDMRNKLLYQIIAEILEERFEEVINQENSPLISAYGYYENFLGDKSAYALEADVAEGKIKEAMMALMAENRRIVLHGFNPGEIERAKASMLSQFEKQFNERDKTQSGQIVWNYVSAFLKESLTPTAQDMFEFAKAELPKIKAEELNDLVKKWSASQHKIITLKTAEKPEIKIPKESELLAWFKSAEKQKPSKLADKQIAKSLLKTKPNTIGKIVSTQDNGPYGQEYKFENGLTVVLKSTDFKDDEILVQGFAKGGHSVFSDQDFVTARFTPQIIERMGLGEFSSLDLEKYMSGKVAQLNSYLDETSQGFRGSSSKKDIETLLQMLHLHFTEPRKDEALFQAFKNQYKEYFKNLLTNPEYYFSYQVSKVLMNNHPRSAPLPSEADFEKISSEKALEIYRKLFGNPADFTLVFVGNIDADQLISQIALYLGSLPKKGQPLDFVDLGMKPVSEKLTKEIVKGKEPKSVVQIMFTGEHQDYLSEAFLLKYFSDALDIKLIEILREKFSGVYSPSVGLSQRLFPQPRFIQYISFSCAPENVQSLVEASISEVKTMLAAGPTETDLAKVKEANRRELEKSFKLNNFWLSRIMSTYSNSAPRLTEEQLFERNTKVTVEDVKKVASQLIDAERVKVFVLNPEK
jgi:zinc protease